MNDPNNSDAVCRTARVVKFKPEQIFGGFADADQLAKWWGPDGFTNTFETFEFREGGQWKLIMHGPKGANYDNESVFRTVDAPNKIVIEHISPPHFILTVTLTATDGGATIDWAQDFVDPAVAAQIKHIIDPANEQNLDRLETLLGETIGQ